jgi:Ca2+-binding RTX toxin-like protein
MNDGYNEAYSSIGNDTILAGDGGSWISAGEGDDKIVGGIGVDYIVADNFYTSNTGADLISGGGGDDVIYLAASEAYSRWLSAKNVSSEFQTGTQELINLKNFLKTEDVVDGGADADTIHLDSGNIALFLHDAFSAFHEEASLSKDSYGNKSVQRIDNIENIFGYDGDNLIDLTSPDYSLAGQNIKISGGNGDDIIWGSDANENILGDAGNDVLFGGAGTNILTGGSGADDFQFTHTSVADTISDYSKADGDVLKFYVRSGAPEATAEFSITGNQLVWGDIAITLDGYTNLSGNDLTIKKQIIGSTLLEDVLIDATAPMANLSAATDDVGSVTGGLSSGDTTDDTALLLSGSNESGSTVEVYNGNTKLGDAMVSGTSWNYTATVADGSSYNLRWLRLMLQVMPAVLRQTL